ncbi:MAG: FAD-dependent oxidoreductase [Deltaproteobacteria bacterium]|nr:FAD-dependent oxidoreductase [Deltaproteobacteria bacterium]
MKNLFSTFSIKGCKLKNRIVMPSLASFLIENDGSIPQKAIEHYRLRAAGGPAMVIMEACAVAPEGIVSPHQARIYDDRFMEGLSKIARTMKAEGTVPAVQLHHGGRQTSTKVIGGLPVAPSPLPCPSIRGEVSPLTVAGIHELVQQFGDAADRAVEAGFELIEIHGAHGYLINQFLSRFSNIREDQYGGDIPGRTRFAQEIVREIRKRVGDTYPISFKISAMEFVKGGLDVEQSLEILKILVKEGVDVVQVSAGNDATPEWICQPMFMETACLTDFAWAIKKELDVPIMAVGRINEPLLAEEIIKGGKADLICIGRGLLADPAMPKKAMEGRLNDIRTCIACNTCMESIFKKGQVECLVNPTLGREKEMVFKPAEAPRKVMVVGAGPGGLNVAWVAARRGHDVHLFERQPRVGGQLILGSTTYYKEGLRKLIRFQTKQMERFGVTCHLNQEVTPGTLKEHSPDVVVLATGSAPVYPQIDGIDNSIVISIDKALNGHGPAEGKRVVVVGGGPTGCEIALHLSEKGYEVTIVETLPKLARQLESMTKRIMLRKLKENSVIFKTECKVIRIEENGVIIEDKDGGRMKLPSNQVVFSIGNRPEETLFNQIQSMGYEIHRIGDCIEPRSAKAAIYEGAVLGRAI